MVTLFIILFFIFGFITLVAAGVVLMVKFLANNKTKCSVSSTRSQNSPPAIPSPEAAANLSKDSIRKIRFDSTKSGIMTASREQDMLESSERAASEWLSNNPELEIISITTAMGGMNAAVTVWYKDTATPRVDPAATTSADSA